MMYRDGNSCTVRDGMMSGGARHGVTTVRDGMIKMDFKNQMF